MRGSALSGTVLRGRCSESDGSAESRHLSPVRHTHRDHGDTTFLFILIQDLATRSLDGLPVIPACTASALGTCFPRLQSPSGFGLQETALPNVVIKAHSHSRYAPYCLNPTLGSYCQHALLTMSIAMQAYECGISSNNTQPIIPAVESVDPVQSTLKQRQSPAGAQHDHEMRHTKNVNCSGPLGSPLSCEFISQSIHRACPA
jgi:hypothetical protein